MNKAKNAAVAEAKNETADAPVTLEYKHSIPPGADRFDTPTFSSIEQMVTEVTDAKIELLKSFDTGKGALYHGTYIGDSLSREELMESNIAMTTRSLKKIKETATDPESWEDDLTSRMSLLVWYGLTDRQAMVYAMADPMGESFTLKEISEYVSGYEEKPVKPQNIRNDYLLAAEKLKTARKGKHRYGGKI